MKSFENKVAAITGAGSGIGRALACHLARQGCHLALSDVNVEGLKETAEQARKLGVSVSQQRVDVADRAAVEAWAEQIVSELGRVNAWSLCRCAWLPASRPKHGARTGCARYPRAHRCWLHALGTHDAQSLENQGGRVRQREKSGTFVGQHSVRQHLR